MTLTDVLSTVAAAIPSPAQGVWQIGPVPLRAYAVCIIIGIGVAATWGKRRYQARGGDPARIIDVAVWAVPFGILGGRIYHVITDNQLYFRAGRNPWQALAVWNGGLGIWGAIALGGLGAWLGCRRHNIRLGPVADALAPAIAVAQALGRLGNYFNQELFGRSTELPWALQVFVRTPAGGPGVRPVDGSCEFPSDYVKASPEVLCGTVHPTFLYELLWNVAVAGVVVWADRRWRLGGGRAFALYVAGYTAGRVWIEMLRVDPANQLFGVRLNVVTSVVVCAAALIFLYRQRHVGREDPAALLLIPTPTPDRADDAPGHPHEDLRGLGDVAEASAARPGPETSRDRPPS